MIETWVPIQGYEGLYEVSDFGRVRSLGGICHQPSGILKSYKHSKIGTESVLLYNTTRTLTQVSRLVAQHFIANPDNLPEVNHIDFNRSNNCVRNLEWVTHKENMFHAKFHGKFIRSSKTHPKLAKKLTEDDVKALRSLKTEGASYKELMQWFSISRDYVFRIIRGDVRR